MERYVKLVKPFKVSTRLWLIILSLMSLLIVIGATLVQADGPHQVGLVIVHGDGDVVTQCIEFSEEELTGLELLGRSDLDYNVDASGMMGGAVCRIDNEGCTYPQDDCFCQCESNTSCIFWSYWTKKQADDWQFSGLGAANYKVKHGEIQGWVWGKGTIGSSAQKPPDVEFDDVCLPPPTNTPSPTPTATPQPTATSTATATPEPTDTPGPTDTPEPEPTPVIHNFSADRQSINAGESVTLRWELSDAEAAYLRYDGNDVGVISPGSQSVAPMTTTVYQLVAENDGGEAIKEITITVNAAPPTATPTNAPVQAQAAAQIAPTATPPLTATPPPTATPADGVEPVAAVVTPLPPTATPLPPSATPLSPETTRPPATPTAGPDAIAVAATPVAVETLPPLNRRFTADEETTSSEAGGWRALLLYAGVGGAILLFLVGPIILFAVGGIAWWLRQGQNK